MVALAAVIWAVMLFGTVVLLLQPRLPRGLNRLEVATAFVLVTYYLSGLAARSM
ncbi:hypothetical protein GCM10023144_17960 [Pigmentiphaga soli]|uniref:Uncharacterized protein n=1 Tax=Pigmentiphaga soli TaxID=1007095 RepID=A0ABP8GUY7_9BURK